MANYYTQMSMAVSGTPEELKWLETLLGKPESRDSAMLAVLTELDDNGEDSFLGLTTEYVDGELCIYSEENFDVDALAIALQGWLRDFNITRQVYFTWASFCDKPVTNEFNGGACIVDKDNMQWLHTSEWVQNNLRKD